MANTAFGHQMWGDLLGIIMIAWLATGFILWAYWAARVTCMKGGLIWAPMCLYVGFFGCFLGPIWLLLIEISDFPKEEPEAQPERRESSRERIEREWREADDKIPHSRYRPKP